MTATILVADGPALQRLKLEGGLRPSFIAVFGGSLVDTADDTPRGDGDGLDDLLEQRRVVCIDRSLLDPIDESTPNRTERERYRHNLVLKLAARQHAWLAVIEGAGEAQLAALQSLKRDLVEASPGAGAGDVRRTIVILVFIEQMGTKSKELVREIRDTVRGVSSVYLMSHRLHPADRGSRAITSQAVWPICVARLLAVRSTVVAPEQGSSSPAIRVWRTLEWGGGRASDWAAVYRAMLRERLMPSEDPGAGIDQDALAKVFHEREGTVDASPETRGPRDFRWEMPAEDLSAAGFGSVDDRVFESVLRGSGERSLDGRALQRGIDRSDGVATELKSRWRRVADEKVGLIQLRRLAEGRDWPIQAVGTAFEAQRRNWDWIILTRRMLDVAREDHRDATEEVAIARSRHLSLLWRMIIAAAVMVFLGQFLASVLFPLRSQAEPIMPTDRLSFMGLGIAPSESVAFLVDCSGSMAGTRIERLKSELENAVTALPEGTPFDIVSFNHLTTDNMVLPGGESALITKSDAVQSTALRWIKALEADGGTDPSSGLARILAMQPPPARIVLMTDGQFGNREAVRQAILDFESRNPGIKPPRIDTVALWWRGEEPLLRAIQQHTGGEYRFVGFDPFAPHGFTTVITVILAATALGVAFGVFVPFWLEVIRGRRGVAALRKSLAGLLREFCVVSWQTQELMRDASEARIKSAVNAAGGLQREFAKRILSVVDRVIGKAGASAPAGPSGLAMRAGSALAGEDRRDLARALDTTLADGDEVVDSKAVRKDLKGLADKHVDELRKLWAKYCEENDLQGSGHLPTWKAEQELSELLERCCDESVLELLFHELPSMGIDRREKLVEAIQKRIEEGSGPTCLSARTSRKNGGWPKRKPHIIWLEADEGSYHAAKEQIKELRDAIVERKGRQFFGSDSSVKDLGVVALGLIHEELPVDFATEGTLTEGGECDVVPTEQ